MDSSAEEVGGQGFVDCGAGSEPFYAGEVLSDAL